MDRYAEILTYLSIRDMGVVECGENLVIVQDEAPEILCEYRLEDMLPYTGRTMLLRQGALQRLRNAASQIAKRKPGAKLLLVYAYRHPEVQQNYFERVIAQVREKFPGLGEDALLEKTHQFVACPDVAGHPTGGAVDVTLVSTEGELDMGTPILDFHQAERLPTFSPDISQQQRQNRILLREALMQEGFAPFNGEWWHFSYGDKEWATFYGKPHAIYEQISLKS